jgi:PAS domain S-box-containing protein
MAEEKALERSDIDRKIIAVSSLFAFLGIGLLLLVVMASNSMSALRSFSTLQAYWTESRKEAAYQLEKYIVDDQDADLVALNRAMNVIESATVVRKQLSKDDMHNKLVRKNLLKTHLDPGDIENMITTFDRLKSFSVFKEAMGTWQDSDSLAYRFYDIVNRASQANITTLTQTQKRQMIAQIRSIDNKLNGLQYRLSAVVSRGAGLLNRLIIGMAIVLGGILLVIALILLFRVLNSITKWSQRIRVSEQRYKSLFEQNPYAVYSMDNEGEILHGNSTFARLFKNGQSGYAITHFSNLFREEESKETKKKLSKVQKGMPLSFEAEWEHKSRLKHLQNTVMPIIVDDEVAGMFGIVEDITYEKNAEMQIKQQLEEKTVLLAEIHHRVKNNLAIISGLLELQQDSLSEEPAILALSEAKTRIQSIAMIHEKIYQNESLADINFSSYIEELSSVIESSYSSPEKKIFLHIDAENIAITLDQSIPCALIINELICNAYEHAFKEKYEGNIWVWLSERDDKIKLTVQDDGLGLPDDWEERQSESLGLVLVQTLAEQLEGSCSVNNDHYTKFDIVFDKKVDAEGEAEISKNFV